METCRSQIVCYNCFQQRDSLDGPCPHCGFDLAENEKKYPVALRAGTVLNGRYIVGRVLGQGGFGITYLAWDTQLVSLDISDGYLGLSGYQTLEALSGLENLAALSLRNYNIRDLSGLEGAHALQNLYIETQNQLTDISALRDLEHLTNVTLIFDGDENLISDMSPLDHVPNVTVE